MDEGMVSDNGIPIIKPIDYHDHLTFTAFKKAGDSEELKDAYTVWKGSMEDYRKAIRDGRELTDPIVFNEVTAQRVMTQRMDPNGTRRSSARVRICCPMPTTYLTGSLPSQEGRPTGF